MNFNCLQSDRQIELPQVRRLVSARFQVSPLPLWSLAASVVGDENDEAIGVGFDRSKSVSLRKAQNESLERWIYRKWERTGVSPFTGECCPVPINTSGFGANSERISSERTAHLEFLERASLEAASRGHLNFKRVSSDGLPIAKSLSLFGHRLETYLTGHGPFVGFTCISLPGGGVIFGSACRATQYEASSAASAECIRKLAFLQEWRSSEKILGPLRSLIRYWIGPKGYQGVKSFLFRSSRSRSNVLPNICDLDSASICVGEIWISYVTSEEACLPNQETLEVPIL
jgi:hypothetical protein